MVRTVSREAGLVEAEKRFMAALERVDFVEHDEVIERVERLLQS